jgi:membrane protein DedA with SNARE-associated domain
MLNHIGRLIVGILIILGAYFLVTWIKMDWRDKIFWMFALIVSYSIGYTIELMVNRKKKKKTFY